MTSKERVLISLDHQEPDHIPVDIQGTGASRIYAKPLDGLSGFRTLQLHYQVDHEGFAILDEGSLDLLRVDTRSVRVSPLTPPKRWEEGGIAYHADELGIISHKPPKSHYYDVCHHPLGQATRTEEISDYPWPAVERQERIAGIDQAIESHGSHATILTPFMPGLFETLIALCGYERTMSGLLEERGWMESLLDRLVEMKKAFYAFLGEHLNHHPDICFETDDLGTQHGPLISPRLYKSIFLPRHRDLFQSIKAAMPHTRILLHSCGAVRWAIPLLIEAGVDILNPVQPSARDMDLSALKRDFGEAITFWGGIVDPQQTLSRGTPSQVRDEVKRHIQILGPGGGFVIAPVHNVQMDVPPENLFALLETIEAYR